MTTGYFDRGRRRAGNAFSQPVLGNLRRRWVRREALEVHGMAQRGGSVCSHVRLATRCFAGHRRSGADIILVEKLEALRWAGRLKKNGRMFINAQEIAPMPVITGAESYPADIEERIRAQVPDAVFVDALKLAEEAGTAKAVNIVLIGVLARHMDIDKNAFLDAIRATIPQRLLDINLAAFEKGYNVKS